MHELDGEAEITVGGVSHRVKAGQMILMPSGTPHAVKAVERFKMTLFLARAKGDQFRRELSLRIVESPPDGELSF